MNFTEGFGRIYFLISAILVALNSYWGLQELYPKEDPDFFKNWSNRVMTEERGGAEVKYKRAPDGKYLFDLNSIFYEDFKIPNPQSYLSTTCSKATAPKVVSECEAYRSAIGDVDRQKSIAIKTAFTSAITSSIFLFVVWLVLKWAGRGFAKKKENG